MRLMRLSALAATLLLLLGSTPALAQIVQISASLPPALRFLCEGVNNGAGPATGRFEIRNDAGAVTTTSGVIVLAPGQAFRIEEFAGAEHRYCFIDFDEFVRADFRSLGAGNIPAVTSMLTPDLSPLSVMQLVQGEVAGFNGKNLIISGANVHVRSGAGLTADPVTGLGNLVVGYAEPPQGGLQPGDRAGSHNFLVGPSHTVPSSGGFVAGIGNNANGLFSSVTGGAANSADGLASVALGRTGVTAAADFSLEPLDTVEANLAQALADAVAALQQLIQDGDQALLDALNDAIALLQQADQSILDALNTAVATLQQAIADGDQAVLDALNTAVAAINSALDTISTALDNIAAGIQTILDILDDL